MQKILLIGLTNVNYEDAHSALLFLLGVEMELDDLESYLNSPGNWWVKTLMVDHSFINSKYIKQKIYIN